MSSKAWVRMLDGETVVFVEFPEPGRVIVSIGGDHREMDEADWIALPVWDGAFPVPPMLALHEGWYIEGYFASSAAAEWHGFVTTVDGVKRIIGQKRDEGFTHFRVRAPAYSSTGDLEKLKMLGTVELL